MDGYEKIDRYNPRTVARIAGKYRAILKTLAWHPGAKVLPRPGARRQGDAVPDPWLCSRPSANTALGNVQEDYRQM